MNHYFTTPSMSRFMQWMKRIGDENPFYSGCIMVKGNYQLQIEARLEDLCDNNLNRAFDLDIKHKAASTTSEEMVTIPS